MQEKRSAGDPASVAAQRMTLSIITAALALSATAAAVIFFFLAQPQGEAGSLLLRIIIPAVAIGSAIVGGFVVPWVLRTQARSGGGGRGTDGGDHNPYAAFGQQSVEISPETLQRFQVAHLIRLASFEGAAMIASVGYFLDPFPLYLVLCGGFIVMILISWPTDARMQAWAR